MPDESPPESSPAPLRIGLAAALLFALGLGAYWLPRLDHPGMCGVGRYAEFARAAVLLLLGLAGALSRPGRVFFGAGGAGFGCGWIVDVQLSVSQPATFTCSHQLLPFEAAIIAALIAVPTWLGSAIGTLAAGRTGWSAARRRRVAGLPAALAGGIVLLTPHLFAPDLRAKERRALAQVEELAAAQFAYRAKHPDIGYACRLSDLSADFPAGKSAGKGHDDVWRGGYHYRLACDREAAPRNGFSLLASPYCVPDCGNEAYCVDGAGEIRALPRVKHADWARDCATAGIVVGQVSR